MIYDGSYGRCDENSRQDLDIKSLTGLTERTEKNEKLCGLCGLCEGKRIVNLRGLQSPGSNDQYLTRINRKSA